MLIKLAACRDDKLPTLFKKNINQQAINQCFFSYINKK